MNNMLIYGVDPDPMARVMLQSIFGTDNQVVLFSDAEECLARIEECPPNVVITDTQFAGLDGFDFCFGLKQNPATNQVKILMVSAEADIESRLHAYDIGVDDYLLKPYAIDEIRRKVSAIQRNHEREVSIKNMVADSEMLTNLLLSNMDEYAVLIRFLRTLNLCESEINVGEAALDMLRAYGLEGVIQINQPDTSFSLSRQGKNIPRDLSVLTHLKSMDRIFSFKNRATFNYNRMTLLVNNMPIGDPETCGRLRDHLAIAAETADGKLAALYFARRESHITGTVSEITKQIRTVISDYVSTQEMHSSKGQHMITDLIQSLNVSLASLGLHEDLEEEIEEMVTRAANSIVSIYDADKSTATSLAELERRLVAALK